MAHAPLPSSGGSAIFVSQSSMPDTEPMSMMSGFDDRPPHESIREGLKQHSIRESHNDCQRCKLSKCPLADIARGTTSFRGMSALGHSPTWPTPSDGQKTGPPFAKNWRPVYVIAGRRGLGPAIRILTGVNSVGSVAIARMRPC